ncbi:MAG: hypothetical protein Q9159_005481 [Coniocarpon cinnabarinum]
MDEKAKSSSPHSPSDEETIKDGAHYDEEQPSRRQSMFARGSISRRKGYEADDPFAGEEEGEVQYRTLRWWQAAMIMIAETISLGILSLPSVLARVGFVPGIILLLGLSAFATYSGYVLGQFKQRYPQVHTMADAGAILFAPLGMEAIGREFFGAAQVIFLIFTMGSHILTWTIMIWTMTDGNTAHCAIGYSVAGMILLWLFDLPRTMKNLSWFSIASFASIIGAVFILMIDVGVIKPDAGDITATKPAKFTTAFNSVSNIVFAYAGHVSFFSFISEFRDPSEFPKALFLLQGADTCMYLVVAVVVAYYTGPDVDSPALGAAKGAVKKVAWGIAIPTIVIAGVIYGHVASKYIYVRLFRGTRHLSSNSFFSRAVWAGIALVLWLIAWILAESIPVFNDLLSLTSALFASWFTYGLSGIFWLFMNWGQWFAGPRKIFLTCVNFALFGIGLAICGIGLYTSGYAINEDSKTTHE